MKPSSSFLSITTSTITSASTSTTTTPSSSPTSSPTTKLSSSSSSSISPFTAAAAALRKKRNKNKSSSNNSSSSSSGSGSSSSNNICYNSNDLILRVLAVWIGICSVLTIVVHTGRLYYFQSYEQQQQQQQQQLNDSSKPPPFALVPIQPFHACNGHIEKVVCNQTIILEEDSSIYARDENENENSNHENENDDDDDDDVNYNGNNRLLLIPTIKDPKLKNYVCNALLLQGEKERHIVTVPVCVQTPFDFVGILVQYNEVEVVTTATATSAAAAAIASSQRQLRNTNNKQMQDQLLSSLSSSSSSTSTASKGAIPATGTNRRSSSSGSSGTTKKIRLRLVENIPQEEQLIRSMIFGPTRTTTISSSSSSSSRTFGVQVPVPEQVPLFRIVSLKYIDYPRHYRNVASYDEMERFIDYSNYGTMIWRYSSTMMFNPITIHTKVHNVNNSWDLSSDEWDYYDIKMDTNTGTTKDNTISTTKLDALVIVTSSTLVVPFLSSSVEQHQQEEEEKEVLPPLQPLIQSMTKRVQALNVPTIVLGLGIHVEYEDDDRLLLEQEQQHQHVQFMNNKTNKYSIWNTNNHTIELYEYQKIFVQEVIKRQSRQLQQQQQQQLQPNSASATSLTNHNTPVIGFRGDFSHSVGCDDSTTGSHSDDYNKNVQTTTKNKYCLSLGCPSLTISRDMNLGRTLQKSYNTLVQQTLIQSSTTSTLRIALAMPSFASSSSLLPTSLSNKAMELFAHITEWYASSSGAGGQGHGKQPEQKQQLKYQVTVIEQDKDDMKRFHDYITNVWKQSHPKSILLKEETYTQKNSIIRTISYPNAESWISDASTYDLCISSRIEGAMTFIANGIPAIVIPTDVRMLELVHSMHIPYILPTEIKKLLSSTIQKRKDEEKQNLQKQDKKKNTIANHGNDVDHTLLLELITNHVHNINFTEFEINRRNKIHGWNTILTNAGLEMDPALLRIIHSSSRL